MHTIEDLNEATETLVQIFGRMNDAELTARMIQCAQVYTGELESKVETQSMSPVIAVLMAAGLKAGSDKLTAYDGRARNPKLGEVEKMCAKAGFNMAAVDFVTMTELDFMTLAIAIKQVEMPEFKPTNGRKYGDPFFYAFR